MKRDLEERIHAALDEGTSVETAIHSLVMNREDAQEARELADVDSALLALGQSIRGQGDAEQMVARVLSGHGSAEYPEIGEIDGAPCSRESGEPATFVESSRVISLFGVRGEGPKLPSLPALAIAAAALLAVAGLGASWVTDDGGDLGAAQLDRDVMGDTHALALFQDLPGLLSSSAQRDADTGATWWVLEFAASEQAQAAWEASYERDPGSLGAVVEKRFVYVPRGQVSPGVLGRALQALSASSSMN